MSFEKTKSSKLNEFDKYNFLNFIRKNILIIALSLSTPIYSISCVENMENIKEDKDHRYEAEKRYKKGEYYKALFYMRNIKDANLTDSDKVFIEKINDAIYKKVKILIQKAEMCNCDLKQKLEYYKIAKKYENQLRNKIIINLINSRIYELENSIKKEELEFINNKKEIRKYINENDDKNFIKILYYLLKIKPHSDKLGEEYNNKLKDIYKDIILYFLSKNDHKKIIILFNTAKEANIYILKDNMFKEIYSSSFVLYHEELLQQELKEILIKCNRLKKTRSQKEKINLSYSIINSNVKDEIDPKILSIAKVIVDNHEKFLSKERMALRREKREEEKKEEQKRADSISAKTLLTQEKEEYIKNRNNIEYKISEEDKRKIKAILDEAEKEYQLSPLKSEKLYLKILKLNPNNSVAKDRLEKIQGLKRIQNGQ